jgi:hypothetical protein
MHNRTASLLLFLRISALRQYKREHKHIGHFIFPFHYQYIYIQDVQV